MKNKITIKNIIKNKNMKIVIGILVVAVVGTLGYSYYKSKQKPTSSTTNYIAMKASKTKLSVNVQGTGSVIGDSRDVSSSANGELKDFSLKVGDKVKAGSKIGSVGSDQLQSALQKAQNNLSKQKIQLSNLNNSLSNAQNQLQTAKNNLSSAQAQAQTAASTEAKAANDKVNSLQNEITTQTNNITNLQNQIATQNINISDAQNDVNSANAQLEKCNITAPIDGVITAVNNSNGDTVQQGKAIVSIMNPDSFKVKVSVDELDISKINKGEVAKVTFGALKDKDFTGKVDTINTVGTTTNNVTTYDVTIALDSIEGIDMGMTANVNIEVSSKDDALVVPVEGLTEKDGKKYVMIPNDNEQQANTQDKTQQTKSQNKGQQSQGNTYSKGKLVEVETGLQNENFVEIVKGIEEGQKILVMLPKTQSGTNTRQGNGGNSFGSGFGGQGGNFGNQGGSNAQKSGGSGNAGNSSNAGSSGNKTK